MLKKLLIAVSFGICVGTAAADSGRDLVLKIEDAGTFDVLYHRADSTATGAVIGGLLGAGIEHGIRSSDDKEKLTQLLDVMNSPKCDVSFLEALRDKLASRHITVTMETGERNSLSSPLFVDLNIDRCGFKMVNTVNYHVSAFVKFQAVLKDVEGRKLTLDENFYFTGKEQFSFETLTEDNKKADYELDALLQRAGQRLANKIIYQKGV